MSLEHEGGKPRGEFSPFQSNTPQHAELRQGSPADSPLAPLIREQQGREERPHEELVEAFRSLIQKDQQIYRVWPPEVIVRNQLELHSVASNDLGLRMIDTRNCQ